MHIKDAINELDAALYSSDEFCTKYNIDNLQYFLDRWNRALDANRAELLRKLKEKSYSPFEDSKRDHDSFGG